MADTRRREAPPTTIHLVCPTAFERRRLHRQLVCAPGIRVQFHQCGVGSAQVVNWSRRCAVQAQSIVILVGLAGGLSDNCPTGAALLVDEVIDDVDAANDAMRSLRAARGLEPRPATASIVSCQRVCASVEDKAALHRDSGADLVDMESAAFARAAHANGWDWLIVRGVSDDHATALPSCAARWLTKSGAMRIDRVIIDLFLRRVGYAAIGKLRRRSNAAMTSAAELVLRLIESMHASA